MDDYDMHHIVGSVESANDDEHDFADCSLAPAGEDACLVRLVSDRTKLEAALARLIRHFARDNGNFAPPVRVSENLDLFRVLFPDLLEPSVSPTPTPVPTSSPSPSLNPSATPRKQPGSVHSRRFWGMLLSLGAPRLLTLDPVYASLFRLAPEAFFLGHANQPHAGQLSHAAGIYAYTRSISVRGKEDKARYAVITLAWQRVIENIKKPLPAPPTAPPRTPSSFKARLRLSTRDLETVYDTYFGSDRLAPTKAEVLAWFNKMRSLAASFTFLAEQLGAGALFFLLPHMTESQAAVGLTPNTPACAQGLRELRAMGLPELPEAMFLAQKVGELIGWIRARIEAGRTMAC